MKLSLKMVTVKFGGEELYPKMGINIMYIFTN